MAAEKTEPLRAYSTDAEIIKTDWMKRMRKWRIGQKRPTVADVIHDLLEAKGMG